MLRFFRLSLKTNRLLCQSCRSSKGFDQARSIASVVRCQQTESNYLGHANSTSSKYLLASVDKTLQQKRFKKKSKKSRDEEKASEEEDDDESDLEYDDGTLPLGYDEVKCDCVYSRLDVVAKTGLKVNRKEVEDALNDDRVRVNNERPQKKSMDVGEGDVIDIVLGRNRENVNLLDVKRLEITQVPDGRTGGRFEFTARRYAKLTIPNYTVDPIESMVTTKDEPEPDLPPWKRKKQ